MLNDFPYLASYEYLLLYYSATLIDHIYSNATSQNYDSGIIICDVADHFGTFYASRKYSSKNLPTYTRTRQMKQVNISNFKQLLSSTEFNTVLSDECPNSAYNTFLHIYKHAYDKAFPLKNVKTSRRYISSANLGLHKEYLIPQ